SRRSPTSTNVLHHCYTRACSFGWNAHRRAEPCMLRAYTSTEPAMSNPKIDRVFARVEPGRREAMRKILAGAVYTAPVVASLSMASLDAVAQSRCANQTAIALLPECTVGVPATSPFTL